MTASTTEPTTTTDLHWIPAGDYTLALVGTTVRARNARGKDLKSVPAKVRKTDAYLQLDALAMWLAQHERTCSDTVRTWFLRGEQVSATLLTAVWADPAWQKYLRDLVVQASSPASDTSTGAGQAVTGLLRGADEDALHLVDLDGESIDIPLTDAHGTGTTVTVPHPVLIEDLDEWREFTVDLGIGQGTDQLFREIHVKPDTAEGRRDALTGYAGARYDKGAVLMGRSKGAGYETTRFEVSVQVTEPATHHPAAPGATGTASAALTTVTAVLSIGCADPFAEGTVGDLSFRGPDGMRPDPDDVGPVAWSEGVRMAEFVYSGRTVEDAEGNE